MTHLDKFFFINVADVLSQSSFKAVQALVSLGVFCDMVDLAICLLYCLLKDRKVSVLRATAVFSALTGEPSLFEGGGV